MTRSEDTTIHRLSGTARQGRRALGISIRVAIAVALVVLGERGGLQAAEDAPADAVDTVVEDAPAPLAEVPAVDGAPPVKGNEEAAIPLDERKDRYIHLEAYWERGLNYEIKQRILSVYPERRQEYGFASDALLSGRIGFRIAVDAAAYGETGGLDHVRDDIDVRRAFVYFTGNFFLVYPASFKVEIGTITDSVYIQSAWVRWRELPYVGTFKVGQYDAPFSLEALGSSNDLTFMESASPTQAFAPGSKFGLQLANSALQDKLTWACGWFADTQDTDVGDASDSLARMIGRLTYVPHDDGADNTPDRRLLHVGAGVTYTFSTKESVRYQSRPESFLAPELVDTGDIDANSAFIVGTEAAWVRGPLSLQAEASVAHATGAPGSDPTFWGLYGYGSYFLTGETRPYSRESATFGHVDPRDPFWLLSPGDWGGWGAWEIAGRYSHIDLSDGDYTGGRMEGFTAGLSWHWNRYIRWQFNYQFMIIDDGLDDGRLHVFQTRIQLVI